eukprot:COSAG01_NODE_63651_length_272_cov_0.661111_1_plen_63_part_00
MITVSVISIYAVLTAGACRQARELRPTYQQVLRGQWLGDALNETKTDGKRLGQGGTWCVQNG